MNRSADESSQETLIEFDSDPRLQRALALDLADDLRKLLSLELTGAYVCRTA